MSYLPQGVPPPQPNPDDQPYWDACARRELRFQRCTNCGRFRHPPMPLCAVCASGKTEWAAVPGTDGWTVDSDTAYTKALAVSGAKGAPAAYMMGLLTFKPTSDTSTVQPFVWSVQFDPGASGATTSSINVDAKTGVATLAK